MKNTYSQLLKRRRLFKELVAFNQNLLFPAKIEAWLRVFALYTHINVGMQWFLEKAFLASMKVAIAATITIIVELEATEIMCGSDPSYREKQDWTQQMSQHNSCFYCTWYKIFFIFRKGLAFNWHNTCNVCLSAVTGEHPLKRRVVISLLSYNIIPTSRKTSTIAWHVDNNINPDCHSFGRTVLFWTYILLGLVLVSYKDINKNVPYSYQHLYGDFHFFRPMYSITYPLHFCLCYKLTNLPFGLEVPSLS